MKRKIRLFILVFALFQLGNIPSFSQEVVEEEEGFDPGPSPICRCHTSDYSCQDGNKISFRSACNCALNHCNPV
jgi:hypothetical protein